MRSNLKLVVNNPHNKIEEKHFFEKDELKIILDLYAKMVSEGSWKDYGLSISVNKWVLVFLEMLLKMLFIKFVKILSLKIKILNT